MKICLLGLLLVVLAAKADECTTNADCTDGECEIKDTAEHKCISYVAEGSDCSYIKNCINEEYCVAVFSGEKREKKCDRGLFCRASATDTNCLVVGTCVAMANANSEEAACLRDVTADLSRCFVDGDYRCSTTETSEGRVTHTCFNPSTGVATRRVTTDRSEEVAKIDCREQLATCTTIGGREVLSGDRVDDADDRCSYCLCKDGVIDRTNCERNTYCDPNTVDCLFNGETIPDGKVATSLNGCIQRRCESGVFEEFSEDKDCNGEDDVDVCAEQTDRDIVCVRTMEGVRARVPKCKARSITNSVYSDKDCNEEACICATNEICVETTRPTELCLDLTTDRSGCKAKRCVPKADDVRCSTSTDTNRKVCSTGGNSYSSECEAFVNQDYELKYLRRCDDAVCTNDNGGRGFCGFDNKTYNSLCDLERRTGTTLRDYDGTCEETSDEPSSLCDDIPAGCDFTTKASDANCPIPGGQCVLHIDLTEAQEYAFRKSRSELDISDLCEVVESDWEKLTGFNIKDDKCELTCRPKYDTVGGIVVQARAETGQCATCGNRMRDFITKVREGKSTNTVTGSRNRRQTDDSDYSGLFINPSELTNDPSFHNGAYSLMAFSLLILISCILAIMI